MRVCSKCGETRGSFRQLKSGVWECLAHLPKLGALADRRRGGRAR